MRRVVSLWLPFWPTERLRRHNAALLADVPLVTRIHDGRRMVIGAACPAAQALGLRAGTPLAHAQAMVPGLAVMDATPKDDAQALARLAAWCLRLSPLTAADPPDGVWIDVTGCAHLRGGEAALLDRLVEQLAGQGLTGRVAVADTPGAAHALARFAASPVVVAASGADATAAAVALLPVAALRLDTAASAGLRRLGLDLVGQLASTPRGPLARRFGPDVLLRLDQALGRVREPLRPVLPPETVVVRRCFVEPLSTAEAFAAVIPILVEEACALLERRGEGARQLDLVFERVDGTLQAIRVGTARPVRDVRRLSRLLGERIEQVDPGPGVEAMRLALPLVEPWHYGQQTNSLAADATAEADLSDLVDRLVNRLGSSKVYRLAPVESDVPERSQSPVPAGAPVGAATWVSPWPRPVRLLDPPEPVDALAMVPDHPPRAFTWRRVRHRVVQADGPERIHGEWWRRLGEDAEGSTRLADRVKTRTRPGDTQDRFSARHFLASSCRRGSLTDSNDAHCRYGTEFSHGLLGAWNGGVAEGSDRDSGWKGNGGIGGELVAIRDYWIVENADGRRFWLFRQSDGADLATGGLSWFLHGFF